MTPKRKRLVLVIFSPNREKVSETFIKAHIDRLPFQVVPYFGRGLNLTDAEGKALWFMGEWIQAVVNRCSPKLDWITIFLLSRLLRNVSADAVLAEYGVIGSWVSSSCERLKLPLFVHFHGYDASNKDVLATHLKSYKRFFRSAAGIVAVSKKMYQHLLDLGASADRLFLNPYGVDPVQFLGGSPEKSKSIFLAVGRFVEKKAPYITVLAFSHVVKKVPSAKLIMIGDGPLIGPCKRLVQGLNLENSIDFLGARNSDEVKKQMRNARAFVQHSLVAESGDSEGTPVAVIEAQMTGIPVIATKHAGIPDVVVDGETGFLVEEADIMGMAEKMIRVAEDPSLANQMGKKGRKRALQYFTMERHLGDLTRMIEEGIA